MSTERPPPGTVHLDERVRVAFDRYEDTGRNERVHDVAARADGGRDGFKAIRGKPGPNDDVEPPSRRLLIADVAVTLADAYAPAAPQNLRDEAAVRAAGWLRDRSVALASQSFSRADGSSEITRTLTEHFAGAAGANALRASGGMALLARYVVRRAV